MSILGNIFKRKIDRPNTPAYGATDTGKQRNNNEDCFFIMTELGLYIVADGMGGHNAGELASLSAVDIMKTYFKPEIVSEMQKNEEKIEPELKNAIIKAHERIIELSESNDEYIGMGSTLAVSFIYNNILHTCHVGDTRVYVINSSRITQITKDHSTVAEMVRLGKMTRDEARHSPLKNRITQAIGGPFPINPEYNQTYTLDKDDIILICSDGLWEMLSDKEIQSIVLENCDVEKTCKRLIQKANDAGGNDNITVILVEIRQEIL
jgi:serine/threonine protein phosphatase PrpC